MRLLTTPERTDAAVTALGGLDGAANIIVGGVTRDSGLQVITADLAPDSVDAMFTVLEEVGVDPESVTLVREPAVRAVSTRSPRGWFTYQQTTLVWAEAIDTARQNAQLTAPYCLYMVAGGTIATCGIILKNPTLIVGAMAVSPDILPLSAFSVGVVGRRAALAVRGLGVLLIGLTIAGVSAAMLSAALLAIGAYDGLLSSGEALSGIVASVTPDTIIVAFAAGVAGMLAFETRASAAVGVAISVTTIPAVAFAGVAVGIGDYGQAEGALVVLLVNVVVLFLAGALTLLIQRKVGRRFT
jgi:uncharacterized hydrophobic protein (TIGR00271 family)